MNAETTMEFTHVRSIDSKEGQSFLIYTEKGRSNDVIKM
jgi:hypothetical protein